jgi:hypothetical protein
VKAGFWWEDLMARDNLEDLGVDRTLNWILKKGVGKRGLDRSGSGEGHVAGACGCGIVTSGSINAGNFLVR